MKTISTGAGMHSEGVGLSVLRRIALLLVIAGPAGWLQSAELLHQFDFKGDLTDTQGTGVVLVEHGNVATSTFGADGWSWTANTNPGGGLKLETALLDDPRSYSLGFRVKYGNVTGYRKIISFKGTGSDNGLYFYSGKLVFYPFGSSVSVTFATNSFYDFIFSRSADNVIRVYVVTGECEVTLVYEKDDPTEAAVPTVVGGKHQFLFFCDDTATNIEWTPSGTVRRIRVWNGTLAEEEVADILSVASTGAATAVTRSAAVLHGLVHPGGLETAVSFEYGTTTGYGADAPGAPSSVTGGDNVAVSLSLSGLAWNTTYHYRVVATNGDGTVYGCDRTFTTLSGPPTVTTTKVSNIGPTTATGGGNVTADGGDAVTARGVCWGTTAQPTLADQHTEDGTGLGAFVSHLTGLQPSTTYYVRAYATNGVSTTYGTQRTFTTPLPLPQLSVSITPPAGAVEVGKEMTFEVAVTNSGDGPATGVVVRIPLPDGAQFVSASWIGEDAGQSAPLNAYVEGDEIVIETGEVGIGDNRKIALVLRALVAGTFTLVAEVTSTETPEASEFQAEGAAEATDVYWRVVRAVPPGWSCGWLGITPVLMLAGLWGWRRHGWRSNRGWR